jgi:hypothetical protein
VIPRAFVAAEQETADGAYAAHLEKDGVMLIMVVSDIRSEWQKRGGRAGAHRASRATKDVKKRLLDALQCALHGQQVEEKTAENNLVDHCLGGETS